VTAAAPEESAMRAVDLIGLLVPLTYLAMLAVETVRPARRFPPRRGWRWLGIAFLVAIGTVSTIVPLLLPVDWLAAHRWLDGTRLGIVGGTLVGWLVLSGISFAWHRASHAWTPLWRAGHQLHHSPQRVDISGSTLFHPVEMVVQLLLQLFATIVVLGLDPLAAALVGYIAAFHGLLPALERAHAALARRRHPAAGSALRAPPARRPREQLRRPAPVGHALRNVRNPAGFAGRLRLRRAGDRRMLAMLAFADVNAGEYGRDSRGVAPPQPA
jgi:hypothetical protein